MPKIAKELTALQVKNITDPGLHAVGGVPGLHLQVTESKARSWVLRVRVGIKRRDVGLGGYPGTTLAQAREAARDVRQQVRNGIDPVLERQAARARLIAAQAKTLTFDVYALAYRLSNETSMTKTQAAGMVARLAACWVGALARQEADPVDASQAEAAAIRRTLRSVDQIVKEAADGAPPAHAGRQAGKYATRQMQPD